MAILPGLPGLRVTIRAANSDLPEYPQPKEAEWGYKRFGHLSVENRSNTYVECTSGAEFKIVFELRPPFSFDCNHIRFGVKLDGNPGFSKKCYSKSFLEAGGRQTFDGGSNVERISPTEKIQKPFRFSHITKVDSSDSDRIKSDINLVKALGEIVVVAYRAHNGGRKVFKGARGGGGYGAPSEVAEKALKGQAISHGVSYGPPTTIKYGCEWKSEYIDGKENPIAVFLFKYRSKEGLESELIIPRAPSPKLFTSPLRPRGGERNNVQEQNDERIRRLKREIAEIKAESQEDETRKRKYEAEEGERRIYKTIRGEDGIAVVDLTDD